MLIIYKNYFILKSHNFGIKYQNIVCLIFILLNDYKINMSNLYYDQNLIFIFKQYIHI